MPISLENICIAMGCIFIIAAIAAHYQKKLGYSYWKSFFKVTFGLTGLSGVIAKFFI